MITTISLF